MSKILIIVLESRTTKMKTKSGSPRFWRQFPRLSSTLPWRHCHPKILEYTQKISNSRKYIATLCTLRRFLTSQIKSVANCASPWYENSRAASSRAAERELNGYFRRANTRPQKTGEAFPSCMEYVRCQRPNVCNHRNAAANNGLCTAAATRRWRRGSKQETSDF